MDDLSDIFDIRHWNVVAFSSKSVDDSELFVTEVNTMREKLFKETSKKFFEDLDDSLVLSDFESIISEISNAQENEPSSGKSQKNCYRYLFVLTVVSVKDRLKFSLFWVEHSEKSTS